MKKIIVFFALIGFLNLHASAQKYYTKNGSITFYSKSTLEDIQAHNNEVLSVLNPATGDLQFSLLNTGFQFEKTLMQEHFNEDYMESDKYPKSTFKGKIINLSEINFTKDGTYNVTTTGDLTMHGVTNKVTATGTVTVKNGAISATSKFKIQLGDYKITIASVAKGHISETIEINVSCNYNSKM